MTDTKRLRPKYTVQRVRERDSPGGPLEKVGLSMFATDPDDINSPFVLMPRKDPAAFAAMGTYMELCEPQLSDEIRAWLRKIAEAEPIFGTQGKRNFTAIRVERLSRVD